MFSVVFPGQGSQIVGMGKDFYNKFGIVKNYFKEADDVLNFSLSKLIFDGPKDQLDLTINTQPAIFLISYSIFQVISKEFNIDLKKAKYFAGHSLGEYSALSCAGYLDFSDTIKILRKRGECMQNSVPKGEGGMLAVLGSKIKIIEEIIQKNEKNFKVQIANDNSEGQIVVSAKIKDLSLFKDVLINEKIKNINLPVSAPFHSSLMSNATSIMSEEIKKLNFINSDKKLISNVTANEISNIEEIKVLLTKQIENRVRWRESVIFMINKGVNQFIEIGPGKVLSGLIKRINKEIKVSAINNETDIENIKL
jgi:[acyl-carrier-protein] S-malonyltransferase